MTFILHANIHSLEARYSLIWSSNFRGLSTPKGLRPFFSKHPKFAKFLAQEAQTILKKSFCTFNCTILPQTTRKTREKSFKKADRMDYEIIMFEVERKVFFPCVQQEQQSLIDIEGIFLNYAILRFCTISMHVMLGTCVPNLRSKG